MKKSSLVAIVIIVLVIGSVFAIFHMSNKPMTSSSTASNASSQAPAVDNAVLVTKTSAGLGQYLVEPNGQPLYTYNGDSSGVSNCTGTCLVSWPAYQDKGSTSNLPAGVGTIKRTDNGEIQYTYNGMPLYTFVSDTNGKVTGNGVSGFLIVKPASTSTSATTSKSSSSTNW
jgi:predicted lipoprotein with Yx(FWY)xxD motif